MIYYCQNPSIHTTILSLLKNKATISLIYGVCVHFASESDKVAWLTTMLDLIKPLYNQGCMLVDSSGMHGVIQCVSNGTVKHFYIENSFGSVL